MQSHAILIANELDLDPLLMKTPFISSTISLVKELVQMQCVSIFVSVSPFVQLFADNAYYFSMIACLWIPTSADISCCLANVLVLQYNNAVSNPQVLYLR